MVRPTNWGRLKGYVYSRAELKLGFSLLSCGSDAFTQTVDEEKHTVHYISLLGLAPYMYTSDHANGLQYISSFATLNETFTA